MTTPPAPPAPPAPPGPPTPWGHKGEREDVLLDGIEQEKNKIKGNLDLLEDNLEKKRAQAQRAQLEFNAANAGHTLTLKTLRDLEEKESWIKNYSDNYKQFLEKTNEMIQKGEKEGLHTITPLFSVDNFFEKLKKFGNICQQKNPDDYRVLSEKINKLDTLIKSQ